MAMRESWILVELTGDNYESGETGYPYTITFNGLVHSQYRLYKDANAALKPTIFNSEGPYET